MKSAAKQEAEQHIAESVESADLLSVALQQTPLMSDPPGSSKALWYDLEKEIEQSLFNLPARHNDVDDIICPRREAGWCRRVSHVVEKPLQENVLPQFLITTPLIDAKVREEDEESFEVLQEAENNYWIKMEMCFNTAAGLFFRGDHDKGGFHIQAGLFFKSRAREINGRCFLKLVGPSIKESVTVKVHDFEPKEVVHKIMLPSLCGFPYLKISVGSTDQAAGRRKLLIIKLLERDSIKWKEGRWKSNCNKSRREKFNTKKKISGKHSKKAKF